MQNFELRLVIVILKLVTWMNRPDIWVNNSNNSELGWISISESWIIIITKFFLWGLFRLECLKNFRVWFIRKKRVGIDQGSLEYKHFCSSWRLLQLHLSFAWFFLMITLFILASVTADHKTATESDLLNNIAGVLKYADKIGAGVVER